jgi:hypothetical protein
VLARVALIAAALLVAGWLAFSLRAVRLEANGRALVPLPPERAEPADVERMDDLMARAARGNPDVRPQVSRGFLLAVAGESRRAIAVIEPVVRREPDNLRALTVLRSALSSTDPAAAERVARRIETIAPAVAPE